MNTIQQFTTGLHSIGVKEIWLILSVLLMDIALSGDNSLAINALATRLPQQQRSRAIWYGLGFASVLRVIALCFVSWIAKNPWIQVVGAFYLFYLVWKHFASEEEEGGDSKAKAYTFGAVLIGIGILDLSLSVDNVIAVVAMSQNLAVVVIGVLASIAVLAVGSQIVRLCMAKYRSLEGAAYVILAFLGLAMLAAHGAETAAWVGGKFGADTGGMKQWRFEVTDVWEIVCVATIVTLAVVKDVVSPKEIASA